MLTGGPDDETTDTTASSVPSKGHPLLVQDTFMDLPAGVFISKRKKEPSGTPSNLPLIRQTDLVKTPIIPPAPRLFKVPALPGSKSLNYEPETPSNAISVAYSSSFVQPLVLPKTPTLPSYRSGLTTHRTPILPHNTSQQFAPSSNHLNVLNVNPKVPSFSAKYLTNAKQKALRPAMPHHPVILGPRRTTSSTTPILPRSSRFALSGHLKATPAHSSPLQVVNRINRESGVASTLKSAPSHILSTPFLNFSNAKYEIHENPFESVDILSGGSTTEDEEEFPFNVDADSPLLFADYFDGDMQECEMEKNYHIKDQEPGSQEDLFATSLNYDVASMSFTQLKPASQLQRDNEMSSDTEPPKNCNFKDDSIVNSPDLVVTSTTNSDPSLLPTPSSSTPIDQRDLLSFPDYGIPTPVLEAYKANGIMELYPWQTECLELLMPLGSTVKNLVYSAPTSAGKTMVAELVMLKSIMARKLKVIMILPFVAIVSEKTKSLKQFFKSQNFKIVGYYGNSYSPTFDGVDIAICTIEKANSLVNKLIEEKKTHELGLLVVDELHMIGDPSRGYLLELLLTKLRFIRQKELQIIGMTATLPNIDVLANWLDAALFVTDYRPVPLQEFIKVETDIYDSSFQLVRRLENVDPIDAARMGDADFLAPLVYEIVVHGHSVLIFCPSKKECENAALNLARLLGLYISEELKAAREHLVKSLARTPGGLDSVLERIVPAGIAFHHSGLTSEERELIESAYRDGILHILTATSTLASGVNLPARRVIFRSPYIGISFLDPQSYKQMKGRAGRKGQDVMGESVLMCSLKDLPAVKELVAASLQPVYSCLSSKQRGLVRTLLEVIVSGVVSTRSDVEEYGQCTLLYAQNNLKASIDDRRHKTIDVPIQIEDVGETIDDALCFLVQYEFVKTEQDAFSPTKLGSATVASSLSPEEAILVYRELDQALNRFVLRDELHIVYHVTPTFLSIQPNWAQFLNIYSNLSDAHRSVANIIGVNEGFLTYISQGMQLSKRAEDRIRVHKRFYTAMMLNDLVHEVDFQIIMKRYDVNRGTLQALQNTAATFAGMVSIFTARLGWSNLELLVKHFQYRLNFGVEKELLELMRIPDLKASKARLLWKAGYKTIASVSCATKDEVFDVFWKARPFIGKGEGPFADYERASERREAHLAVSGAHEILTDEARKASIEARKLMALAAANGIPVLTKSQKNAKDARELPNYFANKVIGKRVSAAHELPKSTHMPSFIEMQSEEVSQFTAPESLSFQVVDVLKGGDDLYQEFMASWSKQNKFAYHAILGPGDDSIGGKLVGLAICWHSSVVYYLENSPRFPLSAVSCIFRQNSFKASFNVKSGIRLLREQMGINIHHHHIDPLLASWCLDPEGQIMDLDQMFGSTFPETKLDKSGSLVYRGCLCSVKVWMLTSALQSRLQKEDLYHHFLGVEMPVLDVLAIMESNGILFHIKRMKQHSLSLHRKLQELEQEAHRLAGKQFDLNLSSDLAKVLFDELGLPYAIQQLENREDVPNPVDHPRQKRRRSTAKSILINMLDLHDLPSVILEYRRLSFILSNHVHPCLHCVPPAERDVKEDCRLHAEFESFTATGRINTCRPNLQNLPHAFDIEIAGEKMSINMRDCIIAPPGSVLLSVDYSHIELRIITHLSQDTMLLKILNQDGDLFKQIASSWFGVPIADVTDVMRKRAKAVCYGVTYGMGAKRLSAEMDITIPEADEFIANFRAKFPGIAELQRRIIQGCVDIGGVETLFGRKRYLPDIYSSIDSVRSHAERQSVNTTIQGSASDLMKLAMRKVNEKLGEIFPGGKNGHPMIILQIHDELLLEVPEHQLSAVAASLIETMTSVLELSVPLPIKMNVGKTWGSMTNYVLSNEANAMDDR